MDHRTALLRFLAAALVASIAVVWFGVAARHVGAPAQLVLRHPAPLSDSEDPARTAFRNTQP